MKTLENENNIPATIDSVGYLTLKKLDLNTVIKNEMEGLVPSFDNIKIPIGGITSFEMPTDKPEETESIKEFSAVILYHQPMRSFYKEAYTGGTNPPNCGSFDNITGVGDPGGECESCLYNEFGTGINGAKACKERRRLYLLREGDIFPMILSLPTGSLKAFSRYLMKCLPKWGASNAGVTKFTLTKATNSGGIVYTKAQFQMERKLNEDEYNLISKISAQIKEQNFREPKNISTSNSVVA